MLLFSNEGETIARRTVYADFGRLKEQTRMLPSDYRKQLPLLGLGGEKGRDRVNRTRDLEEDPHWSSD